MSFVIRVWVGFLSATRWAWHYARGNPSAIIYGPLLFLFAPITQEMVRAIALVMIVGGVYGIYESIIDANSRQIK